MCFVTQEERTNWYWEAASSLCCSLLWAFTGVAWGRFTDHTFWIMKNNSICLSLKAFLDPDQTVLLQHPWIDWVCLKALLSIPPHHITGGTGLLLWTRPPWRQAQYVFMTIVILYKMGFLICLAFKKSCYILKLFMSVAIFLCSSNRLVLLTPQKFSTRHPPPLLCQVQIRLVQNPGHCLPHRDQRLTASWISLDHGYLMQHLFTVNFIMG